jgi:putative transposase
MARPPRLLDSSGGIYHIITRGNNKGVIFENDACRTAYLEIVRESAARYHFALFHYVLMNNHVHLVLGPKQGGDLPHLMQDINHRYSLYHKRRTGRVGHLWETRYKSFVVGTDAYALTLGIYVELNPVRAGIVTDPSNYKWSSYRHYAEGERNRLITMSPVFGTLGRNHLERKAAYRALANMWGLAPRSGLKGGTKNDKSGRH